MYYLDNFITHQTKKDFKAQFKFWEKDKSYQLKELQFFLEENLGRKTVRNELADVLYKEANKKADKILLKVKEFEHYSSINNNKLALRQEFRLQYLLENF